MSDKRDEAKPVATPDQEAEPHKVDETVQEDAAKERTENDGYS